MTKKKKNIQTICFSRTMSASFKEMDMENCTTDEIPYDYSTPGYFFISFRLEDESEHISTYM